MEIEVLSPAIGAIVHGVDLREPLGAARDEVHDALMRWADDEYRSLNAHVEMLLRQALTQAGRMPKKAGPLPRRGRPRAGDLGASGGSA